MASSSKGLHWRRGFQKRQKSQTKAYGRPQRTACNGIAECGKRPWGPSDGGVWHSPSDFFHFHERAIRIGSKCPEHAYYKLLRPRRRRHAWIHKLRMHKNTVWEDTRVSSLTSAGAAFPPPPRSLCDYLEFSLRRHLVGGGSGCTPVLCVLPPYPILKFAS